MWAFMDANQDQVFVKAVEDGVDRVRTGKYAFLLENTMNKYYNNRKPCNTTMVFLYNLF